jgi:hypothetical protein
MPSGVAAGGRVVADRRTRALEAVAAAALAAEVGDGGGAAECAWDDVVDLAVATGHGAAGVAALAVADDDGFAEGAGGEGAAGAEVEDLAVRAEDDASQLAGDAEAEGLRGREGRVVLQLAQGVRSEVSEAGGERIGGVPPVGQAAVAARRRRPGVGLEGAVRLLVGRRCWEPADRVTAGRA